ncbi:MAG: Ig domain-containing protein, partial [Clostridiales bacterium]|nr:Ig domain-containing protein [Clostridiales bacterium]
MGEDVFDNCGLRLISENYYDDTSYFVAYYLSEKTGYASLWNGYWATTFNLGVYYQTHVQDVGWQAYVSNGAVSGTSGESKRLEAIRINLLLEQGGIEYQTHVQDIGWQGWVTDDALSGTSGQSKRLEAIQIRLTDEAADEYDVYYRVHAQNMGWMGWAKNGESAGTAGYSYRLEAIEVKLVAKGGAAPGTTV